MSVLRAEAVQRCSIIDGSDDHFTWVLSIFSIAKYWVRYPVRECETKPSKKLIPIIQETLLYLEFNKPNKQNVSEIDYFKNSTFSKIISEGIFSISAIFKQRPRFSVHRAALMTNFDLTLPAFSLRFRCLILLSL